MPMVGTKDDLIPREDLHSPQKPRREMLGKVDAANPQQECHSTIECIE